MDDTGFLFEAARLPVEVGGKTLYVRQLSADEYMQFVDSRVDDASFSRAASTIAVLALVDKDGGQVFAPAPDVDGVKIDRAAWVAATADTVAARMPFQILRKISDAALEVNGLTEKAQEALAKNS